MGAARPEVRLPHPLQGLSSSPRSLPDIVYDLSGRISSDLLGHWLYARRSRRSTRMPWKSSSTQIPASTVIFSWWIR